MQILFSLLSSAFADICSQCLQLSVKHSGGSVMVWGSISASAVKDFVKTDGIMNTQMCC